MKEGKIDEYVAEFDTLIAQAGYKADDAQTLEKFISGLPASLYETIYQLDDPKLTKHGAGLPLNDKKMAAHAVHQTRKEDARQFSTSKQVAKHQPQSVSRTPIPGSKRYGYLGQDQGPGSSLAH
jgi:hypothetical protein